MSWLRIDDGFAGHPKVTALTYKERWTWMQILCYCSKYDTNGWLPYNISEHVSLAKTAYLNRCLELGLLDKTDEELRVHDFEHYAPKDPTKAERQARWRKRQAQQVDAPVDGDVDACVDDNVDSEIVHSRAGTRRTRPVPSPKEQNPTQTQTPPKEAGSGKGSGRADEMETIGQAAARLDTARRQLASIKAQL